MGVRVGEMGKGEGLETSLFATTSSLHLTTTLTCQWLLKPLPPLDTAPTSTTSKASAKPTEGFKAAGEGEDEKKCHKVCKGMYSDEQHRLRILTSKRWSMESAE